MGGAERSARKRKQQQTSAANAVAAARSGGGRSKVLITVVAVVILGVAVIGGVIYTNSQKDTTENSAIPAQQHAADYPVRRDGPLAVAGKDDAKVTLDVYEDFLCPACGQFEARNADAIESKLRDGSVQVRYHMLPMLNGQSDPPGYSRDSANAGLCAADAGQFPAFHASLFRAQPEEGARGYDKAQLIKLGQDLGISDPQFAECVNSGRYDQILAAELEKTRSTPYLQQTFPNGRTGFATPTIATGEQIVESAEPGWLEKLLAGR